MVDRHRFLSFTSSSQLAILDRSLLTTSIQHSGVPPGFLFLPCGRHFSTCHTFHTHTHTHTHMYTHTHIHMLWQSLHGAVCRSQVRETCCGCRRCCTHAVNTLRTRRPRARRTLPLGAGMTRTRRSSQPSQNLAPSPRLAVTKPLPCWAWPSLQWVRGLGRRWLYGHSTTW